MYLLFKNSNIRVIGQFPLFAHNLKASLPYMGLMSGKPGQPFPENLKTNNACPRFPASGP
jgi:hypothetical protein